MNRFEMPMQTRLAPISGVSAEQRTANLVWSAGGRVKRYDWERGQYYMEELGLDPKNVRMGRLQSGAPVLNAHNRGSLENVIGVVESASVDGKQGRATVRFSDREDVAPIFRDVQTGIIRNVSVGYAVYRIEQLPPDATSDGLQVYRATDWEPMEISLVPIGADAGAGVRSESKKFPCIFEQRSKQMNEAQAPTGADEMESRQSPQERTRIRGIEERCRKNGLDDDFAAELVSEGLSIREAGERILDALATRQEKDQGRIASAHFGDTHAGHGDNATRRLELMSEAVFCRFAGTKPSEPAREFSGLRLVDLARQCLETTGQRTTYLTHSQIVDRALHSTSDFPELLTGTGNRSLRMGYDSYKGGLRRICRPSTAPDFRAKQQLLLGEAPVLDKVPEGGEFKYGTMAESKESYSLATYGKIFGISRQALINDDLNAFVDGVRKFGRAAAEFESQTLVDLLTSNPTMATDGVALFHSSHGNLAGSGAAISITTLGAALKAMRLQKGLDGKTPIDVTPKFLVVPAEQEVLARQYVAQINATKSSDVNPFTADLEVVVDPRLDAKSTTAWYLAADPGLIDTIEYSYLEGAEGPTIESRVGFTVDGVETKVRLDFGAGVLDHRGLYRNPGA